MRVIGKFGGNALSEFSEEYLQDILEPVYRNICLDENNEFKFFTEEALYSGMLGALTSVGMNTLSIGRFSDESYKETVVNNYPKEKSMHIIKMSICSHNMKGFNYMYRMNYDSSPHDMLDESVLERINQRNNPSYKKCSQTRLYNDNDTGCGCENVTPNESSGECGTFRSDDFDYSLAMVYSPHQEWQNLFCEEEGFLAGTIFRELDKPFYGQKCCGGNRYE